MEAVETVETAQPRDRTGHGGSWRPAPLLNRVVDRIQRTNRWISVVALAISALAEILAITLYTITEETRPEIQRADQFVRSELLFEVQFGLSIFFTTQWIFLLMLEEFKMPFILSYRTLATLTSAAVIVLRIIYTFDETAKNIWLPMFLRVWWLERHLLVTLDHPELARFVTDLHREIVRFTIGLLSTMITCLGTFQAVETYNGNEIHLFEASYFIVVTFATIGYGDISPSSTLSRLVVIGIILVALYKFPLFFSNLAELARQKPKFTSFSSNHGRKMHVIIVGSLSDRDVSFFLNEFFSGARRYVDLHIVLLSDVEFSPATRLLVSAPIYKHRVTLVLGDCLKMSDLERCDASYADAIFLITSSDASAFSDYTMIQRTMAVRQFDANLPQHVMLKRERNTKFVSPIAKTVMEKERLKFSLLGMAAVLPGAIPFIVNLVRTYDPSVPVSGCATWREQIEWSMAQEPYTIALPFALRTSEFWSLAAALSRFSVTLIGVVDMATGSVLLNRQGPLENVEKIIVISEDDQIAIRALERIVLEPHRIPVEFEYTAESLTTIERITAGSGVVSGSLTGPHHPQRNRTGSVAGSSVVQRTLDASHLSDHFVLVDLSSSFTRAALSPEAAEEASHFKTTDLLNVIRPLKKNHPDKDILILAREPPNEYFVKIWKQSNHKPVWMIDGSVLDYQDIRKCNLLSAFGVVVFSSEERRGAINADAMTLLTVLSIEEVFHQAREVTAVKRIPIVYAIDQIDSLSLFPPYYSDDSLSALAEDNWAFQPSFVMGNALCSSMLDPALYMTYFNSELLKTVEALTLGTDGAQLSSMRLATLDTLRLLKRKDSTDRQMPYHDLVRIFIEQGYIAVGIARIVQDVKNVQLNGERVMITNPPPEFMVLLDFDNVYYIKNSESTPLRRPLKVTLSPVLHSHTTEETDGHFAAVRPSRRSSSRVQRLVVDAHE